MCVSEALAGLITLEHQGRLLDPGEAPVGVSIREHVHLLADSLSVALDQLDDVAFRIAVAVCELVQNGVPPTVVSSDCSRAGHPRDSVKNPGASAPVNACTYLLTQAGLAGKHAQTTAPRTARP